MDKTLVLYNPHIEIWYKLPLYHYITKRKSVKKYEYIFDELLRRNTKVDVLIDGARSSFPYRVFNNKLFAYIELYFWCVVNKVPFKSLNIIFSCKKLIARHWLLIFMYGNFTSFNRKLSFDVDKLVKELKLTQGKKIVHCTHFMYNIDMSAKYINEIDVDCFIAENDLKKNSPFFKKFFNTESTVFLNVPFIGGDRFKRTIPFNERQNKVVATGTIPYPMNDENFVDFYHTQYIHPMRLEIFNRYDELKDVMLSHIAHMDEKDTFTKAQRFFSKIPVVKKIVNKLYNKQSSYFSFNIVELYNKHKMFIVPEEINDLPGISFIEGIMCGCAYIGKIDPMYTDMGMIPGEHYIGYDGTLKDLRKQIDYYILHEDLTTKIAENGYDFVKKNINKCVVFDKFFSGLPA